MNGNADSMAHVNFTSWLRRGLLAVLALVVAPGGTGSARPAS